MLAYNSFKRISDRYVYTIRKELELRKQLEA